MLKFCDQEGNYYTGAFLLRDGVWFRVRVDGDEIICDGALMDWVSESIGGRFRYWCAENEDSERLRLIEI